MGEDKKRLFIVAEIGSKMLLALGRYCVCQREQALPQRLYLTRCAATTYQNAPLKRLVLHSRPLILTTMNLTLQIILLSIWM